MPRDGKTASIRPMKPAAVRAFEDRDLDAVVGLSLRAWAPVYASLERVLGEAGGYAQQHPDWRVDQRQAVEAACRSEQSQAWVAETDDVVAGFVVAQLDREPGLGEIHMVAVDPAYQHSGIATLLTSFALDWLKDSGMTVAMVETGGDPGHAPARHLYERAGFVSLPIARYFKKLQYDPCP